ncbi:MAG: putative 2-aminoethylphosphonate ABC transporter substrate-binding protein [Lentisphaeria bacterium]
MIKKSFSLLCASAALLLTSCGENASSANLANKPITVYTSLENEEVQTYLAAFKKSNPEVNVNIIRDSTGIIVAKLLAEKQNTPADVIWGVGAAGSLTTLEHDMIAPYKPENFDKILPQFRDKNSSEPRWVGIKATMTGFICNTKELAKNNMTAPTSYSDLLKPEFKNQIITSNPASSGTGYLFVSSVLQNMGEAQGWNFLEKLHENIFMYTHSGSMPAKQAASGETTIGISFGYCGAQQKQQGAPVKTMFPSEKSGWDVEANLLVKKAEINPNAKVFLDWAISDEAMELYAQGFPIVGNGMKVKVTDEDYPANPYEQLAKNDLEWAAKNRARILKTWSEKFDGKSQKK